MHRRLAPGQAADSLPGLLTPLMVQVLRVVHLASVCSRKSRRNTRTKPRSMITKVHHRRYPAEGRGQREATA